jgi:hypothetical protein
LYESTPKGEEKAMREMFAAEKRKKHQVSFVALA